MDLIHTALLNPPNAVLEALLPADRLTLGKRRWRATAEDGREFGFDLAEPLEDGAPFFHSGGTTYIIAQKPEPVIEVALGGPGESARLAWLIGNLHFSVEITGATLRVAADSAIQQMLEREQIAFSKVTRVFHPFHAAHPH